MDVRDTLESILREFRENLRSISVLVDDFTMEPDDNDPEYPAERIEIFLVTIIPELKKLLNKFKNKEKKRKIDLLDPERQDTLHADSSVI